MLKLTDILQEGTLQLTPDERNQVEEMLPDIIRIMSGRYRGDNMYMTVGYINAVSADKVPIKIEVRIGNDLSNKNADGYYDTNDKNNPDDNIIFLQQFHFSPYFKGLSGLDLKATKIFTGNQNPGIEKLRKVLKHELIHAKDPAINQHYRNEPYSYNPEIYFKSWTEFQTMTGQFFEAITTSVDRALKLGMSKKDILGALDNILNFYAGREKFFTQNTKDFIQGTGKRNIFQSLLNFVVGNLPSAIGDYYSYITAIKKYNPEGYREFLTDLYKTIDQAKDKLNNLNNLKEMQNPNKVKNTQLTLEEKKVVAKFILKENKITTLQEVKNNHNILKEIKQNIQFYSGLKEYLRKNKVLQEKLTTGIGWLDTVIDYFGNAKDFLTATSLGKWITEKIKSWSEKIFPKLSKNPNDVTDKLSNFFKTITKWLGPRFFAYIIAAWKRRSVKPGKEAIEAAMPAAEKIYKVILGILIAIAVAKLAVFLAPLGAAALKGFIAAGSVGAGGAGGLAALTPGVGLAKGAGVFYQAIAPLLAKAFTSAGIKTIGAQIFNNIGLVQKIKHLNHSEAEHGVEQIVNQELQKAPAEIDASVKSSDTSEPSSKTNAPVSSQASSSTPSSTVNKPQKKLRIAQRNIKEDKMTINEVKRMQYLAGIINEAYSPMLGPEIDQNLIDTLAKEVEEKFGKNYFLTDTFANNVKNREYDQFKKEKIEQYGYEADMAFTRISNNQRDAALPQIEDIMVAAIPTLGFKKGKFSKDTPEYKKMEADIHNKLGMEKGSGLDELNVLDNYYGSGIMGKLINKHFPKK